MYLMLFNFVQTVNDVDDEVAKDTKRCVWIFISLKRRVFTKRYVQKNRRLRTSCGRLKKISQSCQTNSFSTETPKNRNSVKLVSVSMMGSTSAAAVVCTHLQMNSKRLELGPIGNRKARLQTRNRVSNVEIRVLNKRGFGRFGRLVCSSVDDAKEKQQQVGGGRAVVEDKPGKLKHDFDFLQFRVQFHVNLMQFWFRSWNQRDTIYVIYLVFFSNSRVYINCG